MLDDTVGRHWKISSLSSLIRKTVFGNPCCMRGTCNTKYLHKPVELEVKDFRTLSHTNLYPRAL